MLVVEIVKVGVYGRLQFKLLLLLLLLLPLTAELLLVIHGERWPMECQFSLLPFFVFSFLFGHLPEYKAFQRTYSFAFGRVAEVGRRPLRRSDRRSAVNATGT